MEDRTEVQNEKGVGKLSVVSGIDNKGNIKTTEALAANQAAFLKFNNKDGLLKDFMTNFLKQFNNPTHFGLYRVVADNVEQGVDNLCTKLQSREKPETQEQLAKMDVPFEDYLPLQKNTTAIDPEKVDWNMLDSLGLSREQLEQSGELDKMLNWQKSNLITIAVPVGNTTIYTAHAWGGFSLRKKKYDKIKRYIRGVKDLFLEAEITCGAYKLSNCTKLIEDEDMFEADMATEDADDLFKFQTKWVPKDTPTAQLYIPYLGVKYGAWSKPTRNYTISSPILSTALDKSPRASHNDFLTFPIPPMINAPIRIAVSGKFFHIDRAMSSGATIIVRQAGRP